MQHRRGVLGQRDSGGGEELTGLLLGEARGLPEAGASVAL
jgi:hypothetical protein